MKKIILSFFLLFLLQIPIFGGDSLCEVLEELVKDLDGSDGQLFRNYFNSTPNNGGVELYTDFYLAGKAMPIKSTNLLNDLLPIKRSARRHILRFNNTPSGNSTLDDFVVDVKDPNFLKFINDIENEAAVKTMVLHKGAEMTDEELDFAKEIYDQLSSSLPVDQRIKHWVDRSDGHIQRQARFDLGNKFEDDFRLELSKGSSTNEYIALKNRIPDLDHRSILSNVQLCIETPCSKKGNFFIPDFIAVRQLTDNVGAKYWDVIIVDTKLNQTTTPWTKNQKKAKTFTQYTVKSVGDNSLVTGSDVVSTFESMTSGSEIIQRSDDFVKVYSDGVGNFNGGGIE